MGWATKNWNVLPSVWTRRLEGAQIRKTQTHRVKVFSLPSFDRALKHLPSSQQSDVLARLENYRMRLASHMSMPVSACGVSGRSMNFGPA